MHVARPDLDDLGVFHHRFDVVGVHDLRNDLQVQLLADLGEDLKPLFAETLERIGRCAGFEGAAADVLEAGFLYGAGRGFELLVALDRAGSGDYPEGAGLNHAVGGLYVRLYLRRNVHRYL